LNNTFAKEVGKVTAESTVQIDVTHFFCVSKLSGVIVQDSKGETSQQ